MVSLWKGPAEAALDSHSLCRAPPCKEPHPPVCRPARGRMNILLGKLETIANETGEGAQQSKTTTGSDEFKRLKAHIAQEVKDVREALKEREQLLDRPAAASSKATVQLSHKIRQQLKGMRDDAGKLRELQRKEAARAKGKTVAVQQAEQRQEQVELVFKHLEDVENQERRRYGGKNSDQRVELFSGGRAQGAMTVSATRVPTGGVELPEIETQEGLKMLQRKDQQIDEALEQVAEGVSELKSIALDMRDEVKIQSSMVDEITSKVDSANVHLNSMNKRMKKTLEQTRSADRFILDFILLIILLGIIGYIVSMAQ